MEGVTQPTVPTPGDDPLPAAVLTSPNLMEAVLKGQADAVEPSTLGTTGPNEATPRSWCALRAHQCSAADMSHAAARCSTGELLLLSVPTITSPHTVLVSAG
jgi:hypothetical protein